MGGYGATRIGMKHPDVFGSLYIMSPCCLSPRAVPPAPANTTREGRRECQDTSRLGEPAVLRRGRSSRRAAAWSPNPKNPPLYLDLPTKDGVAQPDDPGKVGGECAAGVRRSVHRQPAAVPRHRHRRRRSGRPAADAGKLHDVLDQYGIANTFEIYSGTHTSKVADRFQNHVMPFFDKHLCFGGECQ